MNPTIQLLPPALCDQIAAGEVLERASSAVKELVENSLDAGAKRIEIEIENGGRSLIRVTDDGCGMSPEDAKASILRHATSKLRSTEDLAAIKTLGFRGEALASMAAVSKMTIITQPRNAETGTLVQVKASVLTETRDTAAPAGTQITITDLFYNTPARLKFLKTVATESRRVYEVTEQLAISHPECHFKLTIDNRVKLDIPAHNTLKERILALFGRDLYENLFDIPDFPPMGQIKISGLLASPEYAHKNAGRLFMFVNQRCVRDKTIQAAIQAAYKEFLHGKTATAILFLEVPYDQIDVNVHPTKHEIRFENQDLAFRCIYRAVRETLSRTPWIVNAPPLSPPPLSTSYDPLDIQDPNAFRSPESLSPFNTKNTFYKPRSPEQFDDFPPQTNISNKCAQTPKFSTTTRFPSSVPHELHPVYLQPSTPTPTSKPQAPASISQPQPTPYPTNPAVSSATSPDVFETSPTKPAASLCEPSCPAHPENAPSLFETQKNGYFSSLIYLGQLSNTYLIALDGDNLVVIDQHAAHERINFEKLKQIYLNSSNFTDESESTTTNAQILLFPVILILDGLHSATLEEYLLFFEKFGFQIDSFGENTFAIKAVPDFLIGYDYEGMIRNALTEIISIGRTEQFQDHVDTILSTMACHRSVRAGMKLDSKNAYALFQQMDRTLFKSNCPHGRPVHFILTNDDIEKRFQRK